MPTPTGKRNGSTTPTFELARREAKLLRSDASAAPLGRSRPEAIAPLDGYGATLGEELQVIIVQGTAFGIDHGIRGDTIGVGEKESTQRRPSVTSRLRQDAGQIIGTRCFVFASTIASGGGGSCLDGLGRDDSQALQEGNGIGKAEGQGGDQFGRSQDGIAT